ncbi:hypothetical protein HK103_004747 [Boothiomyces macroporosus]|uniref:Vacuolar ATPase assembly protein VMA22 n=1 Tax=Boothiomyces macroporosus TaxID=261099 RepID=A0AAD5Y6S3_9FUNG|nr:hypothetical protein HK103_004747 [Boothiomyces macroporosus]
MKKGFVELAQAKYVLGPSVMTRANYDKRMTARYLLAQGESTTLIKNPEESKDPLNWYGVLVPGCLRKSQNNFYSSLEAAVEVHNIVQKIRHLQSLLDGE